MKLMKMSSASRFIYMQTTLVHFHMKGFARGLVLKQRHKFTRWNGLCNNYKNIVLCKNGSTKIVRRFHCRYLEELRSKKIFTKRFHNFNENFSWSSNNKLYELAREHIAGDCLPKKILKQKNKIFIYLALLQYKPNMKREAKLVLSPDTWPSPRFHDSGCLAAPRFLKMIGVTWQGEKRLLGW